MDSNSYEDLQVYISGYDSYCNWGDTQPCPYQLDTKEAKLWIRGFKGAERDFLGETKIMDIKLMDVMRAYDYANGCNYLHGTTNWCAAVAWYLNNQLKGKV